MPGIYKLNTNEFREWRRNIPLLVSQSGVVIRDALEEEINSPSGMVNVEEVDDDTGEPIGLCTVIGAQAKMMEDILAQHGEVVVKAPNNRILKKLRDPNLEQFKNRTTGPAPQMCGCKDWADREEGRHHYMCEQNRLAPEEERSTRWMKENSGRRYSGSTLQRANPRAEEEKRKLEARTPKPVPPNECQCAQFDHEAKGRAHHPMCASRALWEKHEQEEASKVSKVAPVPVQEVQPKEAEPEPAQDESNTSKTGYFLFTANGRKARAADQDEIDAADELGRLKLEGIDFIVCTEDGEPPPAKTPADEADGG